ncbi:MAG: D-tyrosyl-tRNA(Tyr) deacylase [Candidatus Aminicenantes bacterium]|nr:D-tyrosyl-tRNA(Tyr) deacylase [Candidatus Aminicenantes bacterium]
MKVVVQRVKRASVTVKGKTVGAINRGLCVLVGIEKGDSEDDARFLAKKIAEFRIFGDDQDKMNLSLGDIGGEMLAVSQFTLAASLKKGRRPSFDKAELPGPARKLFDYFVTQIREKGIPVEIGEFAAVMEVAIVNDGPVTFVLDSQRLSEC